MPAILTRLAYLTTLLFLTTFGVGWWSWLSGAERGNDTTYMLHFFLGLTAVLVCLGVHCLIFIYFLGTGRWVKEVANAYRIPDDPLPKRTRELKRKAFPPALLAMLVPIAAAAAGTAAQRREWHWGYHAALAVATILVNVWAFAVELQCVRTNVGVLDDVMREVDRMRAAAGLPSNAEALRQEDERAPFSRDPKGSAAAAPAAGESDTQPPRAVR
jgi:hypothetical protein